MNPGPSTACTGTIKAQDNLVYRLMEMFPEACPKYLKNICENHTFSIECLNALITKLLDENYPQRKKTHTPEKKLNAYQQYQVLKQMLSDADPTYLRYKCEKYANSSPQLKAFIERAIQKKDYPTMQNYVKKQQLYAQRKQYTTNFKVEEFISEIPNPIAYFEGKEYEIASNTRYIQDVSLFLKNVFNEVPASSINTVFKSKKNLQKAYYELVRLNNNHALPLLYTKRKQVNLHEHIEDISLLQEMAYLVHKKEILDYIENQRKKRRQDLNYAKRNGLLKTCDCCFDEELLKQDMVACDRGCVFCKVCVERSIEIALGEGRIKFACLGNCDSQFSSQTLQKALNPKLFAKVAQKKHIEEIKAAAIENLEFCSFCDFALILVPEDKIFTCLNPECLKETCRLCREPSHLPLKCEEVNKDDDLKRRVYVENKMSEALMKKCYNCARPFIKSDGCNRIKCPCGALQCYLCGEPITGYNHFNGKGGDKFDLCPLYSETEALHEAAVLSAAEIAKEEIGANVNKLKIDPSTDIKDYYAKLKKKPILPPM